MEGHRNEKAEDLSRPSRSLQWCSVSCKAIRHFTQLGALLPPDHQPGKTSAEEDEGGGFGDGGGLFVDIKIIHSNTICILGSKSE